MSKRIPFGILLANWMVGLLFILLLSQPATLTARVSEGKSSLQVSKAFVFDQGSLPQSSFPEFELGYFYPWTGTVLKQMFGMSAELESSDSNFGTIPLFDVRQTFRQFFDTW